MIAHDNAAPSIADLCRTIKDGGGLIVVDQMDAQDSLNELLAAARQSGRAEDVRVLDAGSCSTPFASCGVRGCA